MTSEDKRKLTLVGWWVGVRVGVIAAAIALAKLFFVGLALVFKAV